MAVTTPRRPRKDPEGRMPLRAHLAELRNRLVKSGLAIGLGAVGGWYAYGWVFRKIQEPLQQIADEKGITANINYSDVMSAFNLHLKVAVYLGIVIASPIWLYQLWAFVLPGLTRREKRHAMGFAAAGVPLFLGGIYLGWQVVPNAVGFFAEFAEPGTSVLPNAGEYIGFVTRLVMVFGIAFLIPLVLVALNMAGLMSARTMAKGWRVAVFLTFLFAAVASPTPDAGSMLALAIPMTLLYAMSVGIATLLDRRRAKRGGAFGDLADDELSDIEAPTPVEAAAPLADDRAIDRADRGADPAADRSSRRLDDII